MGIARTTAITTAANVAAMASGVISHLVLAKVLDVSGYGTYALWIQTVALFVAIGTLGQNAATTYLVAKEHVDVGTALGCQMGSAALVGGVLLIGALALEPWLLAGGPLRGFSPELLYTAIAIVPFAILAGLLPGIFLARQRAVAYALTLRFQNLVRVVALPALAAFGALTVWSAVGVSALAYVLTVGLVVAGCRSLFQARPRFRAATLTRFWSYGGLFFIGTVLMFLTRRLSLFLVSSFHDNAEVGRFAFASFMSELVLLLPTTMSMIILVDLSGHEAEAGVRRTQFLTRNMLAFGSLAALLAPLPLALLVPAFLGSSYAASVDAFLWLLPGTLALTVLSVLPTYFAALDRPGLTSACVAAGVVPIAVGSLLLVPVWGAVGGAIATSIGQGISAIVSVWVFLRLTRTRAVDLVPRPRECYVLARQVGQRVGRRLAGRARPAEPPHTGDRVDP